MHLGKQKMAQLLGDLDVLLGSWLQPGLEPVIVVIWALSQRMGDLYLHYSFKMNTMRETRQRLLAIEVIWRVNQ